jgi:hypothetical protein
MPQVADVEFAFFREFDLTKPGNDVLRAAGVLD